MSTDLDIDQNAKKLPLKMIRLKKRKLCIGFLTRKEKLYEAIY